MGNWIDACSIDDVDEEDLIRFDHGERTFAIYRSPDGEFFCTDGLCTHEQVHLESGLVMGYEIECPKHNATDQQPYLQGLLSTLILASAIDFGTDLPTFPILTGPGIVDASNIEATLVGVEKGAR